MKKLIFVACMVLLLSIGVIPSQATFVPPYYYEPLAYDGNDVIDKTDLKQNPGAEMLLEDYWGDDVTETEDIFWSDTVDESGASIVDGTWWSSQNLVGISWKAGSYWQVFALDPNASSGPWNLDALWNAAGKSSELSNIKGYIGGFAVNEPATMLLLGFGLIGIAGLGRKKIFKN